MKLPRSISGTELASLLRKHGYEVSRQTGSHLRLTSTVKGHEHHITIPTHRDLKVGTLNAILNDVSEYLEMDRSELIETLFS